MQNESWGRTDTYPVLLTTRSKEKGSESALLVFSGEPVRSWFSRLSELVPTMNISSSLDALFSMDKSYASWSSLGGKGSPTVFSRTSSCFFIQDIPVDWHCKNGVVTMLSVGSTEHDSLCEALSSLVCKFTTSQEVFRSRTIKHDDNWNLGREEMCSFLRQNLIDVEAALLAKKQLGEMKPRVNYSI